MIHDQFLADGNQSQRGNATRCGATSISTPVTLHATIRTRRICVLRTHKLKALCFFDVLLASPHRIARRHKVGGLCSDLALCVSCCPCSGELRNVSWKRTKWHRLLYSYGKFLFSNARMIVPILLRFGKFIFSQENSCANILVFIRGSLLWHTAKFLRSLREYTNVLS